MPLNYILMIKEVTMMVLKGCNEKRNLKKGERQKHCIILILWLYDSNYTILYICCM